MSDPSGATIESKGFVRWPIGLGLVWSIKSVRVGEQPFHALVRP